MSEETRKKFIIDRSKWRCGGSMEGAVGKGPTALLNSNGFMCCLGQILLQAGIPEEELRDEGEPYNLRDNIDKEELENKAGFLYAEVDTYLHDGSKTLDNSNLSQEAMEINDNSIYSLSFREELLIELFGKHNIDLEFINKPIMLRDE